MKPDTPITHDEQRALLVEAARLLGGHAPAAAALDISLRNWHRLIAGERRLHQGFAEDLGKALLEHADHCRELERRLNPAFAANRTEAQDKPLHGHTLRRRQEGN